MKTLGVCVAMVVGIYFLHEYQIGPVTQSLLQQARDFESKGNTERAAKTYSLYVRFVPDDIDVLEHLALLLANTAKTDNEKRIAYESLDRVLRLDSDRSEARTRWVSLAIEMGRFGSADSELEEMLERSPTDAFLVYQRAICQEQLGELVEAERLYRESIRFAPDLFEAYTAFARMKQRFDEAFGARTLIDTMVRRNSDNPEAYETRLQFYVDHAILTQLKSMQADMKMVLDGSDVGAETALLAAHVAVTAADKVEARRWIEKGLSITPNSKLLKLGAEIELSDDNSQAAVELLERAVELDPDDNQALWSLCDSLIDVGESDRAQEMVSTLKTKSLTNQGLIYFLEARQAIAMENWVLGIERLKLARVDLSLSAISARIELYLASCYSRIGHIEGQMEAQARAISLLPVWTKTRFDLVRQLFYQLVDQGRLAQAVRLVPADMPLDDPTMKVVAARAELLRIAQKHPSIRDFSGVELLLAQLKNLKSPIDDVTSLESDLMMLRGNSDEAIKISRTESMASPSNLSLRIVVANRLISAGDTSEVWEILDRAEAELGPSLVLVLAKLRHLHIDEEDLSIERLKKLEVSVTSLKEYERFVALKKISEFYLSLGRFPEAHRVADTAAELRKDDIQLWKLLFNIGIAENDDSILKRCIKELRRLEGEDGRLAGFAEVARLSHLGGTDQDKLQEADVASKRLAQKHPTWNGLKLLQARISEQLGERDQAIEYLIEAVNFGMRDPNVLLNLINWLFEGRRFELAFEYLQSLYRRASARNRTMATSAVSAPLALHGADPELALQLALDRATSSPEDAANQLVLAHIHVTRGQAETALAHLEEAIRLAPDNMLTWGAALVHHQQHGTKEGVRETTKRALEALPESQHHLFQARAESFLGNSDEALLHVQQALDQAPDDLETLRTAAQFFLSRGDMSHAATYLNQILDHTDVSSTGTRWAQRRLALALSASGTYSAVQRASQLLEQNQATVGESYEGLRIKAHVLASSGLLQLRQEALGILKKLYSQSDLPVSEQLLMVQLYEQLGQVGEMQSIIDRLHTEYPQDPVIMSMYGLSLVRRGRSPMEVVQRLRVVAPESISIPVLSAHWEHGQGDNDKASKLLKNLILEHKPGMPESQQKTRIQNGLIELENLGLGDAIEEVYEVLGRDDPSFEFEYLRYLARIGKVEDALTRTDKLWGKVSSERLAMATMEIVNMSENRESWARKLEQRIMLVLAEQGAASPSLLLAMAHVRDSQGQYAEGAKLYAQVIASDPSNVTALNNLAWTLSTVKTADHKNGLRLLDDAMRVAGPTAALLDTRGCLLLVMGRTEEAIKDFERAIEEGQFAVVHYHLARALLISGDETQARAELRRARELKLSVEQLDPRERAEYPQVILDLSLTTPLRQFAA